MAVTSAEPIRETHNDQYPLLMERHDVRVNEEHRIDIQRSGEPSSSGSSDQDSRATSSGEPPPLSESSSTSPSRTNSRSSSFMRRSEGVGRRNYSPFNSGFWISIELIFTLSLIIASTTVLYFSRNEHPQAPLFTWVVGYTAGCLASLPVLYWRFLNRNQGTDRTGTQSSSASPRANSAPSQSSDINGSISRSEEEDVHRNMSAATSEGQASEFANSRTSRIMDHFKLALDCFFVVWFIVGTVWIFGGHVTAAEAPHLYRLCIVYLTLSCIGYAMPFILCGMICCCLPCIISVLGIREELNQVRGASDEAINALPTYRFKSDKESTCVEESNDEERGGIVGAGTEKERIISVEDAICCICLERYLNEEELRELPCTHLFHAECVDKWLKINATCPLCKFEVCEREEDAVSSPSQAQPATET